MCDVSGVLFAYYPHPGDQAMSYLDHPLYTLDWFLLNMYTKRSPAERRYIKHYRSGYSMSATCDMNYTKFIIYIFLYRTQIPWTCGRPLKDLASPLAHSHIRKSSIFERAVVKAAEVQDHKIYRTFT